MAKITKEDLKKLLDYGMIAEDEQTLVLASFDHESIEEAHKKFLAVLEASVKKADQEDKTFETEKKKFLEQERELNREIFALRIKKSKIKAEKEIEKYRAEKEAHLIRVRSVGLEYKRSLRKLNELISKAQDALNDREISRARKNLKSS